MSITKKGIEILVMIRILVLISIYKLTNSLEYALIKNLECFLN